MQGLKALMDNKLKYPFQLIEEFLKDQGINVPPIKSEVHPDGISIGHSLVQYLSANGFALVPDPDIDVKQNGQL